jgi:hypothetical protein
MMNFSSKSSIFWISAKSIAKQKSAQKQKKILFKHKSSTKLLFEKLEEMLGFITNRILNALNVTYAPYASCKALMSVTPNDDIKW